MIHLQNPVDGWLEAVDRLPNGSLIKAMDNVQALAEAKSRKPGIRTVLRHHYDEGQVFGGGLEENKIRARTFFNTFIDGTFMQYASKVDFIEEFNEYIASSHNGIEKAERITWATAAAVVWKTEYRTRPGLGHIRLVLCNTAIGNDIPHEYARLCRDYDCVLGYHPYTLWEDGVRSPGDWQWLSGRWVTMDADYRGRGYNVQWLFTEGGPYSSAVSGWRHPSVLNGSVEAYINAIRLWIQNTRGTVAYQQGRVLGFVLFTTGGGPQWEWFETKQPELNALADMVRAEWNAAPEPPTEPPPGDCNGLPRTQYKRVVSVIPANASEQLAQAIFLQEWRNGRRTVSGSYDDAGVGDLTDKTARLYGIRDSERLAYQNFYNSHYPGTAVEFVPMPLLLAAPINPFSINFPFGEPRDYDGDGIKDDKHEGIDIAAVVGQAVRACAPGMVVKAQTIDNNKYGRYIIVRHEPTPGDVWFTWYAHLNSVGVTEGQAVGMSQVIGQAGNSGNSTGPHLHLTVQHLGHGLPGFVLPDVVDPTPLMFVP